MYNSRLWERLRLGGLILSIVVGTLAWTAAFAEEAREPTWLWTVTGEANPSTAALATGHTTRAIRLAAEALDAADAADRAVAAHNLCLAHLARGAAETARPHCHTALAAEDRVLTPERGRMIIGAKAGKPSLLAAMRENIRLSYGDALLIRFVADVSQ